MLCVLCLKPTHLLTPLLCALCLCLKPSYLLTYSLLSCVLTVCFVSCICSTLPGQPSNRRRENLDNGVHPLHGPLSSKAATTLRIQLSSFVVLHDFIIMHCCCTDNVMRLSCDEYTASPFIEVQLRKK